ncbi:mannosyltransferase family protein [Sporomusa aerivorans]|uniref:mannosyltransferase family protein n=1 Tax=Sporomusa aerivorans TaxID=204936 RepID=UPI00352A5F53
MSNSLPVREATGFINPSVTGQPLFIEKFIKWDAHWYTFIAEYGYDSQSIVFFPAIILLIKGLAGLGISYVTAGFILCNVFTMISYCLMAKTFLLDFSARETRLALLAYAVMPTAFFLNSVYTEPVFIVFSLACLYCIRSGSWWSAGWFAALAAMTRSLGILLAVVLLAEYVRYYKNVRQLRTAMASLLFPIIAVAAFCVYNHIMFGDWLAFVHSQQLWGRRFGLPWENFRNNLQLIGAGVPLTEAGVYLDALLVALAFVALVAASTLPRYRLPAPYLITGWLWFLVPMFSTSPVYPLYSMARFVIVILPVYLFLARLPSALFYSLACLSAAGLLFCTAWFLNWYWLG